MRKWAFTELGSASELEFVAMASKNDLEANAEFIRLADSFVEVPPGKNSENYANVPLIVDIAKKQGVDCVWPGWGHASEKPELPLSLAEAGIKFIGPSAPVMHALGDKIASTILAQSSDVPCIPWNGDGIKADIQEDGSIPKEPFERACLKSFEEAKECAKRIGYPVVLKASEGGGGKGIRKAIDDAELKTGWEQVAAEVVGSPVFMMQLCTGARHLEVQLVGDEHGQVVALSGRDCSTQRRFQKIFEEGPPSIANKEDFREAEKAAQRLAMSVGYQGAGTVEYLYKPQSKDFYFLELNPRLQVEHPVTEAITGVNVPALQLQLAMGIPLHRVPDIRRFYGLDGEADSKIDFLEDSYVYPTSHCIAARVTAENPDDAFRPTSGKIERVRFQSSPTAWAYFSIGYNGGIHEFADSQFGHIFASGPTREHARKALQLALHSMQIVGDIRNPTEYLEELLDTDEFKDNTIDTAWLDRLIVEKKVSVKFHLYDMIFCAACFRAHLKVKEQEQTILDGIKRGHLPMGSDLKLLRSFTVEVAFDSVKYIWQVSRTGQDCFVLSIRDCTFEATFREQPDGSLYVTCEDAPLRAQVTGVEEPLGLRLRVEGRATLIFENIRDPSELRSDFNGKLVRYLHPDGADVAEGEPFVELEAMKMIMSLRATSAGKIHQTLRAGAVVAAGELLATLDLADPSAVQMVKPFTGTYELSKKNDSSPRGLTRHSSDIVRQQGLPFLTDLLATTLCGFCPSPKMGQGGFNVQNLFTVSFEEGDAESVVSEILEASSKLLDVFLNNERFFAGLVGGNETQIIQRFEGQPEQLLRLLMAHNVKKDALDVISSVLRSLFTSVAMEGSMVKLPEYLNKSLQEITGLPDNGYGQLKLQASELLRAMDQPLHEQRSQVREMLVNTARKDLTALAQAHDSKASMYFGVDLITSYFADDDESVRSKAAEVYILRTYRGYTVHDVEVIAPKDVVEQTPAACLHMVWKYSPPGVSERRTGYLVVLRDVDGMDSLKKSWVLPSLPQISEVQIVVAKVPRVSARQPEMLDELLSKAAHLVGAVKTQLEAKACSAANVVLAHTEARPTYLHYQKSCGWKEVEEYRNMRTCIPFLIELPSVQKMFTLSPLIHGRVMAIDLGTAGDQSVVFARGATHVKLGLNTLEEQVKTNLLTSFDFLERAMLHPKLEGKHPSSHVFMHIVPPISGTTERDIKHLELLLTTAVQKCIAERGSKLLALRVSQIQIKIWLATTPPMPLKLEASKTMGWDTRIFQETLDCTGYPASWKNVETQEVLSDQDMLKPPVETQRQAKRRIARAAGSTYIYDFPVLFRIALSKLWLRRSSADQVPAELISVKELVVENGELVERNQNGQNTVGMVVWLCTMHTPEYPGGRDLIVVGNDLTIKAGSFGTQEDDLFQKASALARARGIPRIYVACNSGARLGVVEELKAVVQVGWVDKSDLMKGFEYLYVTDEEFAKFPPDSVRSHPIMVDGGKRHVLDAILGLNMKSTKGGIGVENLQGSGLIAGETSRAYQETFTLSYITGRSVGIGAYLNRLGQRNIQMVHGPIILTGYQALNKLLGQQVYTTQDQLGGPHIMVPNGVTHQLVQNDQDGVEAILHWLSYVPANIATLPRFLAPADSIERKVQFMPTKTPYDPRHMLAGVRVDGEWQGGFCDEGSFQEYMDGWGKTVVIGRGRLGGLPVGIVAVETRAVMRHIPADPADLKSHDSYEPQAGQVWYPDSAYKTATAIRDFNRGENLPLIIFANWRGFSGGTRDMFAEVLKYGSMIVDALVEYKHPVTIYIPPNGELRGGAWVVLDPKINPDQMEMFADVEGRGGILEPPAAAEIVFKQDKHVFEMMHRCDPELKQLKAKSKFEDVSKAIANREKLLLPLYKQVAVHYCDLHDRSGRMKGLGAIHEELRWADSRSYLHWRIRRRTQVNSIVQRLCEAVPSMGRAAALDAVTEMTQAVAAAAGAAGEDQAVTVWLEGHSAEVDTLIEQERQRATEEEIYKLVASLPGARRGEVVRDLMGYTRVASRRASER